MDAWVETNAGALCAPCFFALWSADELYGVRETILALHPDPEGRNRALADEAYAHATGSRLPYINVEWHKTEWNKYNKTK